MAQPYFALVTTIGKVKLAASAAGGPLLTIDELAIGDGNGAETNPTAASTALVNEVWRTEVESVVTDPDRPDAILITAIIPTNVGGWWMREFGLFDADGDMIAVAKPVAQYKPTSLEGQLEDIRYEFQIVVGENANVTLLVDPSIILASREWVMTRRVPIAQLGSAPFLPVKSISTVAPPGAPAQAEIYVVPEGATNAWAGHSQELAEYVGSSWRFIVPPNGHMVGTPDGKMWIKIAGTYVAGPLPFPADAFGTLVNNGAGVFSFGGRPLFTGPANPTAADGMDGAMWLNVVTGTIWGAKVAGEWPAEPLPVPFYINDLPSLSGLASSTQIAVSDGANNAKVTAEQMAMFLAGTDYLHSEMFFLGSF